MRAPLTALAKSAAMLAVLAFAGGALAGAAQAAGAAAPPARPAGPPRTVAFPSDEIRGETFSASADAPLQLLFSDGTALTIGPNSALTVDAYRFRPDESRATLSATLAHGVFRFIGGVTAKTKDGVALTTPYGRLVLEGAAADISLGGDGAAPHFDMVFGGRMVLYQGDRAVAKVRKAGYSIIPTQSRATVRKTPAEWRIDIQKALMLSGSPRPAPAAGAIRAASLVAQPSLRWRPS